MSNKTILQSNNNILSTNNLELQNLIELANNLPEAGQNSTSFITNKLNGEILDITANQPTSKGTFHFTYQYESSTKITETVLIVLCGSARGGARPESKWTTQFAFYDYKPAAACHWPSALNINSNLSAVVEEGAQLKFGYYGDGYGSSSIGSTFAPAFMWFKDENNNIDIDFFWLKTNYYTCYLKDTLITLSNNQIKKVQDITYQDDLLVWDFDNGCFTSAKPLWIKKSEIATQYYHCVFENGIILDLVGSNGNCHAIFNLDDNKFEYANNCIGKTIMTKNGPTKLLSCDIVEDTVEFYNIITDYHMNCYANNILTSTTLNNIYPIKDMKFIKENREIIPQNKFHPITQQYYNGLRLGEQNKLSPQEIDRKISILHKIKLEKT